MTVTARCNNAGPLSKPIPTHSLTAAVLSTLRARAVALVK